MTCDPTCCVMSPELCSPWKEFLEELDSLLSEPIDLHCIGGFAIVAAYGLPRSTNDLDYFSLEPRNQAAELEKLAGQGSALARKHKVFVHRAAVASVPENYQERMTELFSRIFLRTSGSRFSIRMILILSKISRNADRDREDVKYLASTLRLRSEIFRNRYDAELRAILIGRAESHLRDP